MSVTSAVLTVDGCTLSGNVAQPAASTCLAGNDSSSAVAALTVGGRRRLLALGNASATTDVPVGGAGAGGGIYALQANLTVRGSVLSSNTATSGGGLFCLGGRAVLTSTTFRGNVGSLSGGAVAASGGARLSAAQCDFASNTAESGGAAAIDDGCSFAVSASNATSNLAETRGGVFFLNPQALLSTSSCLFARNSGLGGAVAFVPTPGPRPLFPTSTLLDNAAGSWGPVTATDNFTATVEVQPKSRSGGALSFAAHVRDGYGQSVEHLPLSLLSVTSPTNASAVVNGSAAASYRARTVVESVSVKGDIGRTYALSFEIFAPVLDTVLTAAGNVTIDTCGLLQARLTPAVSPHPSYYGGNRRFYVLKLTRQNAPAPPALPQDLQPSGVCDCVDGAARNLRGVCECTEGACWPRLPSMSARHSPYSRVTAGPAPHFSPFG